MKEGHQARRGTKSQEEVEVCTGFDDTKV